MAIINVKLTSDYLQRSMKFNPVDALAEIIWNAVDADATNINVLFVRNVLGTLDEIRVSDNGHGIKYETLNETFGNFGNSEKSRKDKTPLGRGYHGRYGYGRFKALAIGSHINWEAISRNAAGQFEKFSISCMINKPTTFNIQENAIVQDDTCQTGVQVIISGIHEKAVAKLRDIDKVRNILIKSFAAYLLAYPGIKIKVDGVQLNPRKFISEEVTNEIDLIFEEERINAILRVLRWKEGDGSKLYLCSENGVSLLEMSIGVHTGKLSLGVYLQSNYIEVLWRRGTLDLKDSNPGFALLHDKVKEIVRGYFQTWLSMKAAEAVQQLKQEEVYPYQGEPNDCVEKVERQVFDMFAVKVHEVLPDFPKTPKPQKKITLGLLKEALRQRPSDLQRILKEVLGLPDDKLKDLGEILNKTSLSAIIGTTKMVSDRLKFINGLEQLLYDNQYSKSLKERSQLHKVLLKELWIFGEHYTYGCDDVKLYNVLKEYVTHLDREYLAKDLQPEEIKELGDIPDICLWSQYGCRKPDEVENLIIELKRPTVKIGQKEICQIVEYAQKVAANPRFPKDKTTWTFLLISSHLDDMGKFIMSSEGRENGRYMKSGNISIYIKEWGEVLNEARARYRYLDEKLKLSVSDNSEGMLFLQEKYSNILPQLFNKNIM